MFVLSGDSLRATLKAAGPVAPPDIDSGIELRKAAAKFDAQPRKGEDTIYENENADFEDLAIYPDDDDYVDDEIAEEEEEGEDVAAKRRAEHRASDRRRELEKRQRKERLKTQQHHKIRNEGDPLLSTYTAVEPGWYRFCVHASYNLVTIEIDVRKSSEFGLDENGDVLTLEEKMLMDEDKLMEQDTAAEEGIKDEDFANTKGKLKTLRRLLADIQSKQQQERHRLIVHSVTNEHSHSHMVLSSLLETVLFMVVTGYQVYTIRRWFKGAPALGR